MTVGFFLPFGKYIANLAERRLPKWNWRPEQVWLPGILLLLIGVAFNIIGFIQGILGFQRNIEFSVYDGLLFFLFTFLTEGTVLLWLAIFSSKQRSATFYIVLAILIVFVPLRMAVLGSRSSLVLSLLPIAYAFAYSGRTLKFRTLAAFGLVGVTAIFIGVTYGTTFRNIKGSEARMNAGEYFGQVVATVDYLSNEDPAMVFQQSAQTLADRLETLSSVGVVVANYEKLGPYEASYGLENNIINDLYTSFIPRFVWPEKPPTSDGDLPAPDLLGAHRHSDPGHVEEGRVLFSFDDRLLRVVLRHHLPVGSQTPLRDSAEYGDRELLCWREETTGLLSQIAAVCRERTDRNDPVTPLRRESDTDIIQEISYPAVVRPVFVAKIVKHKSVDAEAMPFEDKLEGRVRVICDVVRVNRLNLSAAAAQTVDQETHAAVRIDRRQH